MFDGAYFWTSGDYEVSADYARMISGWAVTLEAGPAPAAHVNFADTVEPAMQVRLKAVIGHCIVDRTTCYTPWQVIRPDTVKGELA